LRPPPGQQIVFISENGNRVGYLTTHDATVAVRLRGDKVYRISFSSMPRR
jgi:hypothetical protein